MTTNTSSELVRNNFFIYCFFTIYSRYLKREISKRDGYEYLKQLPSIDGSRIADRKLLFGESVIRGGRMTNMIMCPHGNGTTGTDTNRNIVARTWYGRY
jgi:hypothetical protein